MTSPQGNPARREPLLWLQLLGVAALPLEVAALLLVLAGADPGPLPALERVFCWALGALAPAVLLWRLPPDLWSLLLLQVPLRGRRADQLRLSALQTVLPLKLLSAAGAVALLPLLWWCDSQAGLAWAWSPLGDSPRLMVLLVAAALLALMLWQWQQLVQSLWMLTRKPGIIAQTLPLSSAEAAERRLNLGLPLLLLDPIAAPPPTEQPSPPEPQAAAEPEATPEPSPAPTVEPEPAVEAEPLVEPVTETETSVAEASEPEASEPEASEPKPPEPALSAETQASTEIGAIIDDAPVTPEEAAEQNEGHDLDQQI